MCKKEPILGLIGSLWDGPKCTFGVNVYCFRFRPSQTSQGIKFVVTMLALDSQQTSLFSSP